MIKIDFLRLWFEVCMPRKIGTLNDRNKKWFSIIGRRLSEDGMETMTTVVNWGDEWVMKLVNFKKSQWS